MKDLKATQEDILGKQEEMRIRAPILQDDGNIVRGTHFERSGGKKISGIARKQCYSLTYTHQRPRNLTGPLADGKKQGPELTEHLKIQKCAIKISMVYKFYTNLSESL